MRFFHSEEEAYDFIYQDALSFHQTSEKYGIKWSSDDFQSLSGHESKSGQFDLP